MMGAEGASPVKIVTPSSWTRHPLGPHNGAGTTSRSCDGIPTIPRRILANNGLGNGSLPPDIDLADDSDSVSRSSRLGEIIAPYPHVPLFSLVFFLGVSFVINCVDCC